MKRALLAGLLIAVLVVPLFPAGAATPMQSFSAAEKAKADAAAKARSAALAKSASQATALAHRQAATRETTLIKIRSGVLAETRARIEAADRAAQVNAAIVANGETLSGALGTHPAAPTFKRDLHRFTANHWPQRNESGLHARTAGPHR
jgi:hypothetical protein